MAGIWASIWQFVRLTPPPLRHSLPCLLSRGKEGSVEDGPVNRLCFCGSYLLPLPQGCFLLCTNHESAVWGNKKQHLLLAIGFVLILRPFSSSRHLISSGLSGLWFRPSSPPSTLTSWGKSPPLSVPAFSLHQELVQFALHSNSIMFKYKNVKHPEHYLFIDIYSFHLVADTAPLYVCLLPQICSPALQPVLQDETSGGRAEPTRIKAPTALIFSSSCSFYHPPWSVHLMMRAERPLGVYVGKSQTESQPCSVPTGLLYMSSSLQIEWTTILGIVFSFVSQEVAQIICSMLEVQT